MLLLLYFKAVRGDGRIRTDEGTVLQTVALGRSATPPENESSKLFTYNFRCPTWIRTKTKGSKDPCAAITP